MAINKLEIPQSVQSAWTLRIAIVYVHVSYSKTLSTAVSCSCICYVHRSPGLHIAVKYKYYVLAVCGV